jgi:hypothetical protein
MSLSALVVEDIKPLKKTLTVMMVSSPDLMPSPPSYREAVNYATIS